MREEILEHLLTCRGNVDQLCHRAHRTTGVHDAQSASGRKRRAERTPVGVVGLALGRELAVRGVPFLFAEKVPAADLAALRNTLRAQGSRHIQSDRDGDRNPGLCKGLHARRVLRPPVQDEGPARLANRLLEHLGVELVRHRLALRHDARHLFANRGPDGHRCHHRRLSIQRGPVEHRRDACAVS